MPNTVELADTENQSCGIVHDGLKPIQLVLRHAGQQGMSRHEENSQLVVILLTTMFVDRCLTDSHNVSVK